MSASCRVTAVPVGGGEYALRFTFANDGAEPIEVPSDEPFLAFAVRASAGGAAVPVHEPALDIPVQPSTVRVPAGGTVEVGTPVRLRLGGDGPGDDGFVWTVPHGPDGLSLRVVVQLPAPLDLECAVGFN